MIGSFANNGTRDVFRVELTKEARKILPVNLHAIAKRKLDHLDYAKSVQDLKWPPGNRLEKLKGDFKDFYSIRINEKWRIIFMWEASQATNVQIIDYH